MKKDEKVRLIVFLCATSIVFIISLIVTPSAQDTENAKVVCDSFIINLKTEQYEKAYRALSGLALYESPLTLRKNWELYNDPSSLVVGWDFFIGSGNTEPYSLVCSYKLFDSDNFFRRIKGEIILYISPQDKEQKIWRIISIVWNYSKSISTP